MDTSTPQDVGAASFYKGDVEIVGRTAHAYAAEYYGDGPNCCPSAQGSYVFGPARGLRQVSLTYLGRSLQ